MATKKKISKKEKTVALGVQSFEKLITKNCFYIDKTAFIKEWWEQEDDITLITRPRRFGKTLMMDTVECFFSNQYANRSDLFKGLDIWKDKEFHKLQGTYPVISISFAEAKSEDFNGIYADICDILYNLYLNYNDFIQSSNLSTKDKEEFNKTMDALENCQKTTRITTSIKRLSNLLKKCYGQPILLLIDEYDTPMENAYIHGYWDRIVSFMKKLFNSSLKSNKSLMRAILTGITRISKESLFSDLNNLRVSSVFSNKYAQYFGFTEQEVFQSLKTYGIDSPQYKERVKYCYNGFKFGNVSDIYNPWSITHFLTDNKFTKFEDAKFDTYWANTSGNALIDYVLRNSSNSFKMDFEQLLQGHSITTQLNEAITFNEISCKNTAIWSLMVATGYLKVIQHIDDGISSRCKQYVISITNGEVLDMFSDIVDEWFDQKENYYNQFIKSLLKGNISSMQDYLEQLAMNCFSYWDVGSSKFEPPKPKQKLGQNKEILKEQEKQEKIVQSEKFYHGLILGLVSELRDQYVITSNRESGIGRYDCILNPKDKSKLAYILEFKVCHPKREKTLKEALKNGLQQIENENYAQILLEDGIPKENIKKFAFAFKGKDVLVGEI